MARVAAFALFLNFAACSTAPPVPTVVVAPLSVPGTPPPAASSPSTQPTAMDVPSPATADVVQSPAPLDDPVDFAVGGVIAGGVAAGSSPPLSAARRAKPMATDWNCRFPPESDRAEIDEALVVVKLSVDARGKVDSVQIVRDPGNGFGREAVACAKSRRFVPATDEQGQPVADSFVMRIRFTRPQP
jgi:TonB family protein